MRVLFTCFLLIAVFVPVAAHEAGDRVVVKIATTLTANGKSVDKVGPGQILTVLRVDEKQLWVSRGEPGWIADSAVLAIEAAEPFFLPRFRTGAGASDYLARGNVRIALGRVDDGVKDLQRAVELASDKLPYLEALGYGFMAAHNQEAAVTAFTGALKLRTSPSALMGRGLAFYQMGQNDNATSDFEQAIALKPNHAFPRKYYGALLHDLGKLTEAQAQLSAAIKLDSYDTFTRKATGRLLYDLKRYENSLAQFNIALTIDKNDVEAIAGRGVVLHAIGADLPAAKAAFESAIAITKPSMDTAYLWNNLGQVQIEMGESEAAMGNLNQAIDLDPFFNEARSHRAWLIAKNYSDQAEMVELAKADLKHVFNSSDPKTYWDYRALAAINQKLGNRQKAAQMAQLAGAAIESTAPRRFGVELILLTKEIP